MRCLENRKHCRSPSFFREREPRRPRVILPFSDMGTWMREPVGGGRTLSPAPGATLPSGRRGSCGGSQRRDRGVPAPGSRFAPRALFPLPCQPDGGGTRLPAGPPSAPARALAGGGALQGRGHVAGGRGWAEAWGAAHVGPGAQTDQHRHGPGARATRTSPIRHGSRAAEPDGPHPGRPVLGADPGKEDPCAPALAPPHASVPTCSRPLGSGTRAPPLHRVPPWPP